MIFVVACTQALETPRVHTDVTHSLRFFVFFGSVQHRGHGGGGGGPEHDMEEEQEEKNLKEASRKRKRA